MKWLLSLFFLCVISVQLCSCDKESNPPSNVKKTQESDQKGPNEGVNGSIQDWNQGDTIILDLENK